MRNLGIWILWAFLFLALTPWAQAQSGPIRITKVALYDLSYSSSAQLALDTTRGTCGRLDQNGDGDTFDEGDFVLEEFSDDLVGVTIANDSVYTLRVEKMSYRIPRVAGKKYRSIALAPSSAHEIAAGEEKEVLFLFTKTQDDGTKQFIRSSSSIPDDLGFRSVFFEVRGRVASNSLVRLSGRSGMSFGDVDHCGG